MKVLDVKNSGNKVSLSSAKRHAGFDKSRNEKKLRELKHLLHE
jgi:hypothetical protein